MADHHKILERMKKITAVIRAVATGGRGMGRVEAARPIIFVGTLSHSNVEINIPSGRPILSPIFKEIWKVRIK